jgi:hypothetical protein
MLALGTRQSFGLFLRPMTMDLGWGREAFSVVPPERRSVAVGLAGACGSFGQFAMLPWGQALISAYGWLRALCVPTDERAIGRAPAARATA